MLNFEKILAFSNLSIIEWKDSSVLRCVCFEMSQKSNWLSIGMQFRSGINSLRQIRQIGALLLLSRQGRQMEVFRAAEQCGEISNVCGMATVEWQLWNGAFCEQCQNHHATPCGQHARLLHHGHVPLKACLSAVTNSKCPKE